MSLPDPEVAAKVVLGAMLSPSDPVCAEIVQSAARMLEDIVERVEAKGACAVWCVGECPCKRPPTWKTCYYDGCGRAAARADGIHCPDHDREKDLLVGRRWVCACGWWGLDHQMHENSSGGRVCPDCGGSGGIELATPRTYGGDPSRGLSEDPGEPDDQENVAQSGSLEVSDPS